VAQQEQKLKNNHFVPRSYLKRFCAGSEKQIALYNIDAGLTVPNAPIKSQCSRDYFHTKNPAFETSLGPIEARQKALLDQISSTGIIPVSGSQAHRDLSTCVIFQVGRTVKTVKRLDHLANEFGKAVLRLNMERDGDTEALALLPHVELASVDAVIDNIGQHLLMYPLIDDLNCTLLVNETAEDFLTSDHPVALCNSIPTTRTPERSIGFASRGLIILYPISSRELLFFSDAEVYKIDSPGAKLKLRKVRNVIELNLAQFSNSHENVYFSSPGRVQKTLEAFRKRVRTVRPPPPVLSETTVFNTKERRRILLTMPRVSPRLSLPKAVEIRSAARTGKYALGNELVRDPNRIALVKRELRHVEQLRQKATDDAKTREAAGSPLDKVSSK